MLVVKPNCKAKKEDSDLRQEDNTLGPFGSLEKFYKFSFLYK